MCRRVQKCLSKENHHKVNSLQFAENVFEILKCIISVVFRLSEMEQQSVLLEA